MKYLPILLLLLSCSKETTQDCKCGSFEWSGIRTSEFSTDTTYIYMVKNDCSGNLERIDSDYKLPGDGTCLFKEW